MPKITQYKPTQAYRSPSQTPQGFLKAKFRPQDFDSGLGAGIKTAYEDYTAIKKEQDNKDRLWANKALAEYNRTATEEITAFENDAELGAEGHVDRSKEHLLKKRQELLAQAPESVREQLDIDLYQSNTRQIAGAISFQSSQAGLKAVSDMSSTLNQWANTVDIDPTESNYAAAEAGIRNTITDYDNPRFNAAGKDKLLRERLSGLDNTYLTSRIKKAESPEAVDAIMAEITSKDSKFASRMNPDDYRAVAKYADAQRKSLVSKIEVDKANAEMQASINASIEVQDILTQRENGLISDADLAHELQEIKSKKTKTAGDLRRYGQISTALRAGQGASKKNSRTMQSCQTGSLRLPAWHVTQPEDL